MGNKLYVGNLPYSASDQSLGDKFAEIGEVESSKVIMDRETGRSKGFGFITMVKEADAQTAIARFNGTDFEGRSITVNEAKPMEPRDNNRRSFR